MTLYVQIVDNEVKQVWDTVPPAGQDGWREAVELRAPIQNGRQGYTAHRFDLTTTPVQIIWSKLHTISCSLIFNQTTTIIPSNGNGDLISCSLIFNQTTTVCI